MDLGLPFFVSTRSVILSFAIMVIVLDLVLVRWLKLRKAAWKRLGYVTLGLAAFGLIGAASESRRLIASNYLEISRLRTNLFFSDVRGAIRPPSDICTPVIRGKASPPPKELNREQDEYNEVCAWWKRLEAAIPAAEPENSSGIVWAALPQPPDVSDVSLKSRISELRKTLDYYNSEVKRRKKLESSEKRSDIEVIVVVLTPLFLTLALALSITKVTGEIKLDA
jgi:hypothetical protein